MSQGKVPNNETYEYIELIDSLGNSKANINENIKDYFNQNSSNIITQGDTTIEFIDTSKESNSSNNSDISSIDLGDCETVLRKHYEIPHDESLLIMKIDKKLNNTHLTYNVNYSVYNSEGKQLDLSVCTEAPITIKFPIKESALEEMSEAKRLFDQGINVNNINDPFFNNICFPFTSSNRIDIPLSDIKKDMYKNNTGLLCQKGCSYQGIDYNRNIVECSCSTMNETSENESISSLEKTVSLIAKEFFDILLNSNIGVVTCYQLVFDVSIIKDNFGLYLSMAILVTDVVILIMFFSQGLKPLKQYIFKQFKDVIKEPITVCNPPVIINRPRSAQPQLKNRLRKLVTYAKYNYTISSARKPLFNKIKLHKVNSKHDGNELDEMSFKNAIQYDKRSLFIFY